MDYTIEEFNDIDDWWEFRDFCERYGVQPSDIDLGNICDADYISECVIDMARDCRWSDITEYLEKLDWNGDHGEMFDIYDGPVELTADDLETAKEQVLSELHANGEYLDGEEEAESDEGEETDYPCYINSVNTSTLYGSVKADGGFSTIPDMPAVTEEEFELLLNSSDLTGR